MRPFASPSTSARGSATTVSANIPPGAAVDGVKPLPAGLRQAPPQTLSRSASRRTAPNRAQEPSMSWTESYDRSKNRRDVHWLQWHASTTYRLRKFDFRLTHSPEPWHVLYHGQAFASARSAQSPHSTNTLGHRAGKDLARSLSQIQKNGRVKNKRRGTGT